MSRHFDPADREWLADAKTHSDAIARDLDVLIAARRETGGFRLVRHFLERWMSPGRCYRVLDLYPGPGDAARRMIEWARERDITLRIDAMDPDGAVLDVARSRSHDFPEIEFVKAEILREQPDATYDLVHSSLALHRFSDPDAARVLIRLRELASRWALVTDFERHPLTTATLWTLSNLIHRSDLAAHDLMVGARHSFSFPELRELAATAGWQGFGQRRMAWCCQAIWLEYRDAGDLTLAGEMPSLA